MSSLWSARRGLELLTKPQLVAALSPAARASIEQTLRQHEAAYSAQLDLIAASGKGDPSQLCNDTYASLAGCTRAVAADSAALRDQVFPVYSCGRVIPGQFETAKDAPAERQRDIDHPEWKTFRGSLTFDQSGPYYQKRLQQETELLEKLKQAR